MQFLNLAQNDLPLYSSMLDSNHLSNNGLTSVESNTSTEQIKGIWDNASNLKSLIPNNVSANKKAVIERLIALHLSHD